MHLMIRNAHPLLVSTCVMLYNDLLIHTNVVVKVLCFFCSQSFHLG